ncbi:MAG: DMT family transporter [Acidobacteria bacterium]|nr:DMT family transporter [Acidobacteriota bacterium]
MMRAVRAHAIAVLLLFLNAFIWGGTFVVVRDGIASVSPELFMLLRFTLASLLMAPFALASRRLDRRAIRSGAILGLFLFLGFWLQTRGLLSTSPLRSAFLTALSVVFVPLLDMLFRGAKIGLEAGFACLLALGGTLVLVGGFEAKFTLGDLLTVLCSLAFAVYLVLASERSRASAPTALTFVQLVVVALLSAPLAASVATGPIDRAAVVAILITALLATSAAFFILMWAQAHASALEVAIILSLEPVAAALVSYVTGDEPITAHAIIGGTMIVGATILSQIEPTTRDSGDAV